MCSVCVWAVAGQAQPSWGAALTRPPARGQCPGHNPPLPQHTHPTPSSTAQLVSTPLEKQGLGTGKIQLTG